MKAEKSIFLVIVEDSKNLAPRIPKLFFRRSVISFFFKSGSITSRGDILAVVFPFVVKCFEMTFTDCFSTLARLEPYNLRSLTSFKSKTNANSTMVKKTNTKDIKRYAPSALNLSPEGLSV